LAEKYSCHPSTIGRRARKEGWRSIKEKAGPKVKPIFLLAERVEPEDIAVDHRDLWKGVRKRLVKGLKSNDLKQGMEELKVAKVAGEVLTNVIKGERQAWGLKDEGEEIPDDTQEITREMASFTVPQRASKAVD